MISTLFISLGSTGLSHAPVNNSTNELQVGSDMIREEAEVGNGSISSCDRNNNYGEVK